MSPSELDLVDSHCHLDFPDLIQETEAIIARARAAGVNRMVTICTRLKNEPRVRALAEANPEVFYAAGTHPMSAAEEPLATVAELVTLASHPRFVGIGETGLDYHYDFSPRDDQLVAFGRQLDLARALELPVVLHIRDAHDDAWAVLAEHPARAIDPGVVHCFTGTPAEAERWVGQIGRAHV